jgi:alcohol dehydrogenase, propanol-preferring
MASTRRNPSGLSLNNRGSRISLRRSRHATHRLSARRVPGRPAGPPHECSVTSPHWGYIRELIEVITLAQTGKIQMLVEHFTLDPADKAYQLLHDGKVRGRAVVTAHS